MQSPLGLLAFSILWLITSAALAQPPHPPAPPARPTPQATVVTRVNVNVDTDVHVAPASDPATAGEDDDEEDEEEDDDDDSFGELVEAVLKQAGTGPSINVITDININVRTSVRVKSAGPKSGDAKPHSHPTLMETHPKPDAHQALKEHAEKDSTKPNDVAPRKKKRPNKGQGGSTKSVAPEPEETHTRIALSKLKFGKELEVGLTGQVSDELQAQRVADQINTKRQQSLLGLAFLGMVVPEQQDSLTVVRQAVSSVNAVVSGKDISVSVAIPRETPQAIKTLVEAALDR